MYNSVSIISKGNLKRSQQPPESLAVEHNLRGVAKVPARAIRLAVRESIILAGNRAYLQNVLC